MELLVLGGTSFVGRHVVERALAEGHAVTTFNRGRTNPGLFPEARSLHGDRTSGDYAALADAGPFDAVVDTSAYFPRAVREAVAALGPDGPAGPYILISSVSVYAQPEPHAQAEVEGEGVGGRGFTEESALGALPDGVGPASEDVTGETYGPLKVLAETAARALLPDGQMVIRPGLIVGPYDPTDRFTYWVRRMADGGEVLAPESPEVARTQLVDAADLADWIVASAAAGRTGTYNAVAPAVPLARVLGSRRVRAGGRGRSGRRHRLGAVGVPGVGRRRTLDRPPGLASAAVGRPPPGRRVEGGCRRVALAVGRRSRGRPGALGPGPVPTTAPGRHDPGAGSGAPQSISCGGPAARAMSQPRARSARG